MSALGKRLGFAGAKYTTQETMQDVLRRVLTYLVVTTSNDPQRTWRSAGRTPPRALPDELGIETRQAKLPYTPVSL